MSVSAIAWQRFKRNKPAVAGLLVIASAALIAILGYLVTPDQTPFANDQKPELHIKNPGFTVNQLTVRINGEQPEQSFLHTMVYGKPDRYMRYPFVGYRLDGANILISEYTGNENQGGDEAGFNLADVVYALDPDFQVSYDSLQQSLHFKKNGAAAPDIESISSLREKVVSSHLTQKKFLLGSDLLGRDLLSRLIIGTRISLSVGFISVFISLVIGISLGAIAGYFRGIADTAITWLINIIWSIPTLLLVIAITLVLGKGVTQVFIAVGLTMWVDVARVVRGQFMGLREKEFVEAGKALGFSHQRIIFRHILPNVTGPVIVMAAGNFASAILLEAGLSFLGIGAQPPIPSWGEMTNAHRGYILMDKAYLAFIPGLAIMLLVLAFMMVGNGLRDAMDSKDTDSQPLV